MAQRHHHRPAARVRRSGRLPVVIAAVAAVATGAVLVVQGLAGAGGCSERSGLRLVVAADPAIAPALHEVATEWAATGQPEVDGRCVAVDVTEAATAEVASVLATSAGGFVNVGIPARTPEPTSPADAELPAVWVPDSSYWLDRLRSVSRTMFDPEPPVLATSPVVLAALPPVAELFGDGPVEPAALAEPVAAALQDPEQAALRLSLAEPRRDTAGLVGAGWLRSVLAPDPEDLPDAVRLFRGLGEVPPDTATLLAGFGAAGSEAEGEGDGGGGGGLTAAPVSEQAVTAYNQAQPATPLTAVPVVDAPTLDFPYALLARTPRAVQTAAGMFRDVLTAAGSGEVLARHGFRAPDGTAAAGFPTGRGISGEPVPVLPVGPPEQLVPLLRTWTSSRSDARVLSVVNLNASMQQPIADGIPVPRITVFRQTAALGVTLFTPNSQLGHWEYGQTWTEGVPVETLTEAHQQAIVDAAEVAQVRASNQSAMFDTLLAAYRFLKEGHDPTRSNTLVLWTDGGDNASELNLDETLRELELLADVTRPIRVILLGLGQDVDMATLQTLAEATGGGAYQLVNPDEVRLIFLQALLT